MRGLLKKDLALVFENKRMFLIMFVITVFLLITGNQESATFAVSYFTILCGFLVLTTISYDEFDHSNTFLMTLPVTRTLYAVEKYVFALLLGLFGWLIANGMALIAGGAMGYDSPGQWWVASGAILVVLLTLVAFMIPIQLKFGGDNGRIVGLILVVAVVLIVFGAKKLCAMSGIDLGQRIDLLFNQLMRVPAGILIACFVLFLVLINAVFLMISVRIMKNKQF